MSHTVFLLDADSNSSGRLVNQLSNTFKCTKTESGDKAVKSVSRNAIDKE